jgi:hypothetical protein
MHPPKYSTVLHQQLEEILLQGSLAIHPLYQYLVSELNDKISPCGYDLEIVHL